MNEWLNEHPESVVWFLIGLAMAVASFVAQMQLFWIRKLLREHLEILRGKTAPDGQK